MRASIFLLVTSLALGACDDGDGESTPAECTTAVKPGDNDSETLQTAFIEADSGDVICLRKGTYVLDRELSLANAANVTVKGIGATRDDVVLDFASQTIGDDGVVVTAPGFTIENLTVKNSPGNGIVAHAELSTFRNLKVYWDAGSVKENGFYAVYPTDCKKTIIEDCEVVGASDAGIYVGSCEYAIVRRNKVHGNVAGLEIENSTHADVYENEVYDNTAGILALVLPKQVKKKNQHILIRDNHIYDNNRNGFATSGTVVSYVPRGIGILSLAGQDIEIRDNEIRDNDSVATMVVSFKTYEILTNTTLTDTEIDPYLRRVYIHGNTFTGNGTDPALQLKGFASTFENVVWDGVLADGDTLDDAKICLGTEPTTFRNIAIAGGEQSTDTTGHTCTLPEQAPMTSFEGIP